MAGRARSQRSSFSSATALVLATLLLVPAAAQVPISSGPPPNSAPSFLTGPILEFDLPITPRSPLFGILEGKDDPESNHTTTDWTVLLNGSALAPDTYGRVVDGTLTYRLGSQPDIYSQFYLPVFGKGARIEGSVSPEYDGWLFFFQGLGREGRNVSCPYGPVLVDDALDNPNVTRRTVQLSRNSRVPAPGTV